MWSALVNSRINFSFALTACWRREKLTTDLSLVAKAWAVATIFLIYSPAVSKVIYNEVFHQHTCRPLNLVEIKRSNSFPETCAFPLTVFALPRKLPQISIFASRSRSSYFSIRWILLRIASSNSDARFVVKKMIPSQYSSLRRNTETSPFLMRSWEDRRSK